MESTDIDSEAFRILEEEFSEELRNEAYSIVLDQMGKFIEHNKLRRTDFPQRANSALYVLVLALVKKNLVSKEEEAASYLKEQFAKIRDSGIRTIEDLFREITA
jgi:hypothetical protein